MPHNSNKYNIDSLRSSNSSSPASNDVASGDDEDGAPRSDVATVCSQSVLGDPDFEAAVESEQHFQEEEQQQQQEPRSVISASMPQQRHAVASGQMPPLHPSSFVAPTAAACAKNMGPPLNRALLIPRSDYLFGHHYSGSQSGSSVKSYGSFTGSEGGGTTHEEADNDGNTSQEEQGNIDATRAVAAAAASAPLYAPSSPDGDAQSDDCGGSLDVETHSVRSLRSVQSSQQGFLDDEEHQQDEHRPVPAASGPLQQQELSSPTALPCIDGGPGGDHTSSELRYQQQQRRQYHDAHDDCTNDERGAAERTVAAAPLVAAVPTPRSQSEPQSRARRKAPSTSIVGWRTIVAIYS